MRRQRRAADPWIDLGLLRRRSFALPLAANALAFFVLYATQLFIAQYLQLVLGLSPLHAGLWTIPSALGYLAGSALAPVAANRMRPAWLLGAGLALSASGFALLAQSGLAAVVAGTVVSAVGLAPVYVVATDLTVAAAPAERAGTASALVETCANLGGALGIAVLGTLGAAVYRHAVPAASGAPATDLAATQSDAAQAAFTLAFRVVEGTGAAVLAVVAVAAVVGLSRG